MSGSVQSGGSNIEQLPSPHIIRRVLHSVLEQRNGRERHRRHPRQRLSGRSIGLAAVEGQKLFERWVILKNGDPTRGVSGEDGGLTGALP